jgi:hypothetical protein
MFEIKGRWIMSYYGECLNRKVRLPMTRNRFHQQKYREKNRKKLKESWLLYKKPVKVVKPEKVFKHPRIACVCGSVMSKLSKYTHFKSYKHMSYIKNLDDNITDEKVMSQVDITSDIVNTIERIS